MEKVWIYNYSRPEVAPILVKYCDSFLCRFKGLMFSPPLEADRGLLLVYKRENRMEAAIHMLAVKTDLAIAWLNHDLIVVDRRLARKGKLMYVPSAPACYVLEMNPCRLMDFYCGEAIKLASMNTNSKIIV